MDNVVFWWRVADTAWWVFITTPIWVWAVVWIWYKLDNLRR